MIHLVNQLGDPLVIGLTGTPPEGKSVSQERRYLSLVGDIDYQVPTPALVREGGLAPFQDLVYFTEPTEKEFKFLKEEHTEFHELVRELSVSSELAIAQSSSLLSSPLEHSLASSDSLLSRSITDKIHPVDLVNAVDGVDGVDGVDAVNAINPLNLIVPVDSAAQSKEAPLSRWINQRLRQIASSFPGDLDRSWRTFSVENLELSKAICRYASEKKLPWPFHFDASVESDSPIDLEDWMMLLEDFASHKLKLSSDSLDHQLYSKIQSAARKLGYTITEQGLRRQASLVDRVLAFSNSKSIAVTQILETEYRSLEDRLRAAVITDFEKMSATATKTLKGVLSEDSGGAVAVLRALLASPIGSLVNPCLVTGSLLLIDRRVANEFLLASKQFLQEAGYSFALSVKEDPGLPYSEIYATNSEWESRLYVGMATAIFERGVTKCLIGTRGLFGEGWDSQALNTLIDLTNTTSPVAVKQLRGRSIRINTNDPLSARKVANNWDVVCIAPSLEKGLNDFKRFIRKHNGFFGICEDGQIECGVGHVHSSLATLTGAEVFASASDFNFEMIKRALVRERIYDLWQVGQPYRNQMLGCIELRRLRKLALTPPHIKRNIRLKEHAKQLRSSLAGVWYDHLIVGGVLASFLFFVLVKTIGYLSPIPVLSSLLIIGLFVSLAAKKYNRLFSTLQTEICRPNTQQSSLEDIALAVLVSLQLAKLMPENISKSNIQCIQRPDGSYRLLIRDVSSEHCKLYMTCLSEVVAPIINQPFVIPKFEYFIDGESDSAAKKEKKFFRSYLRGRAEPRVACYHALPGLLGRSEKNRQIFESCWNKYVSPGFVLCTEREPQILDRYFRLGPSLAERLLWE
jgi:hypothetical protein